MRRCRYILLPLFFSCQQDAFFQHVGLYWHFFPAPRALAMLGRARAAVRGDMFEEGHSSYRQFFLCGEMLV